MAQEISIMVTARDKYTAAITKMQRTQTSFRKDLGQLGKELDAFNKTKVSLQVDLRKAKNELKDAQKAFDELGDAASESALEMAQANYNQIEENLRGVSSAAKKTQKDMENLTGVASKTQNKLGTSSGSDKGLLKTLGQAGLLNMLGQSLGDATGAAMTSAYGDEAGTMFSGVLGSAASGASIGMLAGPWGAAIGAAVGALTGAIQSATAIFQKRDDYFKSIVQDEYNNAKEAQSTRLASGSQIAGARETSMISFTTLFGDAAIAKDITDEMKEFANVTPFVYDDIAKMGKVLKTYGYTVDEIMPMIQKIGDTGAALGMSTEDMSLIATYLGRMKTTNKAALEYLNPLLERGIPVYDYLAESLGKSKDEAIEMLNKGLIPGSAAAEAIAQYMGKSFAGSMELMSQTYEGLTSTVTGLSDELDAAMGKGYNDKRINGLKDQIEWLSGESGAQMQEAYGYIGEFQASLENEKEQMLRDAYNETMGSDEFATADAVGKGRMLMEAQVKAQADYIASDGYQLQLEADKQMVENMRESLAPVYESYGYDMMQAFNKGLASVPIDNSAFTPRAGLTEGQAATISGRSKGFGRASGQNVVPYDGFLMYAHQGEQLLTASQARERAAGGSGRVSVSISGNEFVVREQADIDAIASALCARIESAQQSYTGGAA